MTMNNEATMTATYQHNILDQSYNGWSNWETWNVALWLQNDVNLYYLAQEMGNYVDTVEALIDSGYTETRDGVKWDDPAVNVIQINSEVFDF
jgi:hypothetical protein